MYIGEGGVRVKRKCSKVIVGCTNSERIQKYKCVDLYDRSRIRSETNYAIYRTIYKHCKQDFAKLKLFTNMYKLIK